MRCLANPSNPEAFTMIARILLILAFPLAFAAGAAEVEGVKIDDKTRVGNADLSLNGAGLRKRVFFKVYTIGLYLPQRSATPAAILQSSGPKRVAIHML